ncbi:hypothetical protein BgAZ_105260 [Babesia gibsoni]|uniref:Uncharacterized protein n=1 Tax=Babesia gibsoni TaxID=33632 RepID=A0AAD8PG51_BABGI|nr:hypothetical protein BgAZ_105260 [Babesia gibsoni]
MTTEAAPQSRRGWFTSKRVMVIIGIAVCIGSAIASLVIVKNYTDEAEKDRKRLDRHEAELTKELSSLHKGEKQKYSDVDTDDEIEISDDESEEEDDRRNTAYGEYRIPERAATGTAKASPPSATDPPIATQRKVNNAPPSAKPTTNGALRASPSVKPNTQTGGKTGDAASSSTSQDSGDVEEDDNDDLVTEEDVLTEPVVVINPERRFQFAAPPAKKLVTCDCDICGKNEVVPTIRTSYPKNWIATDRDGRNVPTAPFGLTDYFTAYIVNDDYKVPQPWPIKSIDKAECITLEINNMKFFDVNAKTVRLSSHYMYVEPKDKAKKICVVKYLGETVAQLNEPTVTYTSLVMEKTKSNTLLTLHAILPDGTHSIAQLILAKKHGSQHLVNDNYRFLLDKILGDGYNKSTK